jgi:hypothetical protein
MSITRRAIALLAACALIATLGAVPVAAFSLAGGSALCDPHDDSGELGRGGPREPDLGQLHRDLPASAKGVATSTFSATVPVYFHSITDGTTGALTDQQIVTQIGVLNNTYSAGEGGATTGFSFRLAGVTRTDNAAWFAAGPAARTRNP